MPSSVPHPSEPSGVRRLFDHPIVRAGSVDGYGPIFNAGLLYRDDRYHLFARGVRNGYSLGGATGPTFVDYLSDVLVFTSTDGEYYDFGYVLAAAGTGGALCYEDPRVQVVGTADGPQTVMTYTYLPRPGEGPWRIGAHRLHWDGERFGLDPAGGRLLGPPDVENKDGVIFNLLDGRVALIQRIHPDMQLAVFDDLEHLWSADDPRTWDPYLADLPDHVLLAPRRGAMGVGVGAPPVVTADGLLLFFHERQADTTYTMNVALLDHTTGRVLSRLMDPVLEPELEWETLGDVDRVIFVQGAHLEGDSVYLTYGAADSCVGAAVASVPQLLAALARTSPPDGA